MFAVINVCVFEAGTCYIFMGSLLSILALVHILVMIIVSLSCLLLLYFMGIKVCDFALTHNISGINSCEHFCFYNIC